MDSQDKILKSFIECDNQITILKFQVIKNQYPLENFQDWQKFRETYLKLNQKYQELKSCLPNIHPEYGKQDNTPFINNMIAVIKEMDLHLEENFDYKKLKASIRVLTIFQEYDNIIKQAEYYSKAIVRQTNATKKDIRENPIVISKEMQEKFQKAIEQQKKLLPKYREAQEFLFGSRNQEQTDTKSL